jgi:hypothetical protein
MRLSKEFLNELTESLSEAVLEELKKRLGHNKTPAKRYHNDFRIAKSGVYRHGERTLPDVQSIRDYVRYYR